MSRQERATAQRIEVPSPPRRVARGWYWLWVMGPLTIASYTAWAILVAMPATYGELAQVYADFTDTSMTRLIVRSVLAMTTTMVFTIVLIWRARRGRVRRPLTATLWQSGVSVLSWFDVWGTMGYAVLTVEGDGSTHPPSRVAFWIMALAACLVLGLVLSAALRRASSQ